VSIILLGSLTNLSVLDQLILLDNEPLNALLGLLNHVSIILTVNVTPVVMLALLWLETDIVEGLRNNDRLGDNLARIWNVSAGCLGLCGAWAQNASLESLLALIGLQPSLKLMLIHCKTVVVAANVLGVDIRMLSGNFCSSMDHSKKLLLALENLNDSFVFFYLSLD
jgi:hypothetical protein